MNHEREFIGWLGERTRASEEGGTTGNAGGTPGCESGMVVLSWEPRIFLYKGILTDEECDQLIENSERRLHRSGVSDSVTGAGSVSEIRTSSGTFYAQGETPLVARIEKRLAMWTMLPVENGEGIQVLRYQKAQKYDPHHDYFSFKSADLNGGNRMATVLMYLATPEERGETVFPKVKAPPNQTREHFSECAMQGYAVKPRKGDAVLGEKWSATKWIHVGRLGTEVHRLKYVPPPPPAVPGCKNTHELCEHWAESGECESNPGYMAGSKGNPGACNLACNRCDLV
ncbi:hypothetical protein HYH03_018915 [Edaphochlamys debaryana]|uniref:Fe2OG dioxygenase domain-containing protein n=1 Tax=Edaphochlamys debaryana TaxID=47281 RepID=A0A835XEZ2_9CHLO|nr:hypothetical protein HYH03_018915 [Edaphochlamys debaryana]|eukprot:KAG2482129.1 hypothetical protein HYH03_018915 [Edaphochlamys debaryana]